MELRNNNSFCTIDHKRTLLGHIRDQTKVYVLNHRGEILVIRVGAIQFQLGLQRYAIGHATLQTFIYAVTRWIDIIVEKL